MLRLQALFPTWGEHSQMLRSFVRPFGFPRGVCFVCVCVKEHFVHDSATLIMNHDWPYPGNQLNLRLGFVMFFTEVWVWAR